MFAGWFQTFSLRLLRRQGDNMSTQICKGQYCLTCRNCVYSSETEEGIDILCFLETETDVQEVDGNKCPMYDPAGHHIAYQGEERVLEEGVVFDLAGYGIDAKIEGQEVLSPSIMQSKDGESLLAVPAGVDLFALVADTISSYSGPDMPLTLIVSILNWGQAEAELMFLWLSLVGKEFEFKDLGKGKRWCDRWTHVSLSEDTDEERTEAISGDEDSEDEDGG